MIDIASYFSKTPRSIDDVMPKSRRIVTCLNHYTYYLASQCEVQYDRFDYIAMDGILVQKLYNLLNGNKRTPRISVDMTSLVPKIFDYAIENNKSVYFLGARQYEAEQFIDIIKLYFPKLLISGYRNGYFDSVQERLEFFNEIVQLNPDIIFIGTGTPLQDRMSLELQSLGYTGSIYTCGGFIHQTQTNINYYPSFINKLNLRFLYRIFNEKNIYKRIFPSLLALLVFLWQYFRYFINTFRIKD
jgi:N-acetylglucosaminyldiphosphoundecaprenol N-acetyl-beta-D-mannosaminyltransferase